MLKRYVGYGVLDGMVWGIGWYGMGYLHIIKCLHFQLFIEKLAFRTQSALCVRSLMCCDGSVCVFCTTRVCCDGFLVCVVMVLLCVL